MRLLLDTQAFLYFVLDNPALGRRALNLIRDTDNERLLSIASFWEIAIKVSIGKLSLAQPFDVFLAQQVDVNVLTMLPISIEHVATLSTLPFHHRDPFDRMLVAQSMVEGLPIVSGDAAFDQYGVQRIWS